MLYSLGALRPAWLSSATLCCGSPCAAHWVAVTSAASASGAHGVRAARWRTSAVWPRSVRRQHFTSRSHTRMVASLPPDNSKPPAARSSRETSK